MIWIIIKGILILAWGVLTFWDLWKLVSKMGLLLQKYKLKLVYQEHYIEIYVTTLLLHSTKVLNTCHGLEPPTVKKCKGEKKATKLTESHFLLT